MNQREWKTDGAKVELTAASSVTKESNSKWSTKYDLTASYETTYAITTMPRTVKYTTEPKPNSP